MSYEYESLVEEYSIDDVRRDLKNVVSYFKSLPYHKHAMDLFLVQYREMPYQVADMTDAFCVDEDLRPMDLPEWMHQKSLGVVIFNEYLTMAGRCVFPVKAPNGDVAGFVGWDPTVDPKYLDSKNYGYKAKTTLLYGMENIEEYYKSKEPVFITEGLQCTNYLRLHGFHAMSTLGSNLTPYYVQILKRFGRRLYMVPDYDEAGEHFLKQIKYKLPMANSIMVRKGKDIDGCRREHEEELLKELSMITNPMIKTNLIMRR